VLSLEPRQSESPRQSVRAGPCASRRFASALRALRGLILWPALCRDDGLGDIPPFEELAPLPQRSSAGSGLYCPSPSTLIRPHLSHSQATSRFPHCDLYGCLRCPGAPRRHTTGSVLSVFAGAIPDNRMKPSDPLTHPGTADFGENKANLYRSEQTCFLREFRIALHKRL
jgi:hypothetical protein